MTTIVFTLISLSGITAFYSCEKIVDTAWVYYDETYCSDPWGLFNVEESEKRKNVEAYYKEKGINIFQVKTTEHGIRQLCEACNCKSGKRIECKIKSRDVPHMINEGFYQ